MSDPSTFSAVRNLSAEDEPALVRFFEENNLPEVTQRFRAFPLDANSAARICRAPGRDRYFGIFLEHEMVALGLLRGWEEGHEVPSFGLLVGLRFRARRLGKRLALHALSLAGELGSKRVRITVDQENASLLELAHRMGFQIAGTLPGGRIELFAEL